MPSPTEDVHGIFHVLNNLCARTPDSTWGVCTSVDCKELKNNNNKKQPFSFTGSPPQHADYWPTAAVNYPFSDKMVPSFFGQKMHRWCSQDHMQGTRLHFRTHRLPVLCTVPPDLSSADCFLASSWGTWKASSSRTIVTDWLTLEANVIREVRRLPAEAQRRVTIYRTVNYIRAGNSSLHTEHDITTDTPISLRCDLY